MKQEETDIYFMRLALAQAQLAQEHGEVPVGAIVVVDNEVIASGYNQNIMLHDPSAHAEMIAIKKAAKHFKNYRIPEATLYVTLEPCPMCTGLLVHSRIKRLVFGTHDLKTGACGSVFNINRSDRLNHLIDTTSGVLADDCRQLISGFFKQRRDEKKRLKAAQKQEAQKKSAM